MFVCLFVFGPILGVIHLILIYIQSYFQSLTISKSGAEPTSIFRMQCPVYLLMLFIVFQSLTVFPNVTICQYYTVLIEYGVCRRPILHRPNRLPEGQYYTVLIDYGVCPKATVIEMKSGRVCGPVPKWKRDNTPAHAETPKTAAMRKESEPETSTTAVVRPDSDVDSLSADSTYDNRSSGDWYCDYTSSYIESDR